MSEEKHNKDEKKQKSEEEKKRMEEKIAELRKRDPFIYE